MSKLIKSLAIVASLFATSVFANDCGIEIYKAFTANHKKEVKVCLFSQGNGNFVQYRFGKLGEKPELEFIIPAEKAEWEYHHNSMARVYSAGVTVPNGPYVYDLYTFLAEDGIMESRIEVSKSGKELAKVKLDADSVESNLNYIEIGENHYNLSDFGMEGPEEGRDEFGNLQLAPKRN